MLIHFAIFQRNGTTTYPAHFRGSERFHSSSPAFVAEPERGAILEPNGVPPCNCSALSGLDEILRTVRLENMVGKLCPVARFSGLECRATPYQVLPVFRHYHFLDLFSLHERRR
jgi:hypothetical protein